MGEGFFSTESLRDPADEDSIILQQHHLKKKENFLGDYRKGKEHRDSDTDFGLK